MKFLPTVFLISLVLLIGILLFGKDGLPTRYYLILLISLFIAFMASLSSILYDGLGGLPSLLISFFVLLLSLTLVGRFDLLRLEIDPEVTPHLFKGSQPSTLFVVVHGYDRGKDWSSVSDALRGAGDVLLLKYPFGVLSNADPKRLSRRISKAIQDQYDSASYSKICLIGQSIGALLVRRAFLEAEEKPDLVWSKNVTRVVLLAGTNRGWDISGKKASDMHWTTWITFWSASWFAKLSGTGKLILSGEAGAPFVANLRLDWMNRMREREAELSQTNEGDTRNSGLEVVQLLGDIDNIVSAEDNKDLRAIASSRFAWIRVRGTGHSDISNFSDSTIYGGYKLGDYRKEKFLLASTGIFSDVLQENEEQSFKTDDHVTHIVFVLHGIRDLGQWSAAFEKDLNQQFKPTPAGETQHSNESQETSSSPTPKLAVASIRYGYFGMGPFLLRPGRQKFVEWFMDEYTETLARYPNAEHIHFVGHSNGTYLLSSALENYASLKVQKVVFGGSVVRRDYNWNQVFENEQAQLVRNYVAADDWVVALFPRFFEPRVMKWMGNDIGSAGFNGFDFENNHLINERYIEGGHGAFLKRIPEISNFLLSDETTIPKVELERNNPNQLLRWVSPYTSIFVWLPLAALVLIVGWFVVTSASEPRWPVVIGYVILVILILKNA